MDKRLEICLMILSALTFGVFGQTIRLVSPLNNGVGRLEVFYNGTWGTVCDDVFGADEAKVACRQLGRYYSGLTPSAIQRFGFGGGRIWLDNVNCNGTESSLASCSHNPWGVNNCGHNEDVGIICNPSKITMKLAGYKRGLLQVLHSGSWGTVCDDGFGQVEASVVCRALGYQGGKAISGNSPIKMWLDDVQCTLLHKDLKDCKHLPWGTDNCVDSQAVGVECFSFPEEATAARLFSTTNTPGEGVLELYYQGQWGRVQYAGFSVEEATVACRMLGHHTIAAHASSSSNTGSPSRRVIQEKVHCFGTELSLNDCLLYPWGRGNSSSTVVRIQCPNDNMRIDLEPKGNVLNVFFGQIISVKCVVYYSNFPVTSFRWTYNGRTYSEQTFRKTITSKSDSGTLTCGVRNLRASTQINVWYPPEVHLEPSSDIIDIGVGEDLRVQCVVDDANPNVTTFRWSHNGRTTTGSTFLQRNVTKSDQGQFSCTADNGHMMKPGRVYATVNVKYPPEIHLSTRKDVISVIVGDAVEVECVVDDANPAVTSYTWRHNGDISYGQTFLKIVSSSDTGNLSCSVTNRQGTSTVHTSITVLQALSFTGNVTAIATGTVGLLLIIFLLIIIIYQRRKMQAAKPTENPQRPTQVSRAGGPRRRQNNETTGRQSAGAENTYCSFEMDSRNDAEPAHIYGNLGLVDEETATAPSPSYGDIQLEISENIQKQRAKERKVNSTKVQTYDDEPIYENTLRN